jgi:hypothetical protein
LRVTSVRVCAPEDSLAMVLRVAALKMQVHSRVKVAETAIRV